MTTTVPGTTLDLLGRQTQPRMSRHDIVCVHTMAGFFEGTDSTFHANGFGGLESHLGVRADGFTKQWQDLEFTADANAEGNHRIISIETEDHGPEFGLWTGSNVPVWTPQQVHVLIQHIRWICDHYNIPKTLVPDSQPHRRGIAFHRQGIDPWRVPGGEVWSESRGKVCPGDRRIQQLKSIIIPALNGDDDVLTQAEHDAIMDTESRSTAMYKALRNDDDADQRLIAGIHQHIRQVLEDYPVAKEQ